MMHTNCIGICNQECNAWACYYDGGDCTQQCDFTTCDWTSLGDGICDSECYNAECSYDYCDCFDWSLLNIDSPTYEQKEEIEQCSLNATLCEIKTDCHAKSLVSSWVHDGYCDNFCNNDYCHFDGNDCASCENAGCEQFWEMFEALALSDEEDYKISQKEMCSKWNAVMTIANQLDFNCSEIFATYDRDNDTMLNGYEATILIYLEAIDSSQNATIKANQLNCSLCAPTVDIYYGYA